MDFKTEIAALAAEAIKTAFPGAEIDAETAAGMLETPPDQAMGDYALPCFKLSKALRKSPVMIAEALSAAVRASLDQRAEENKASVPKPRRRRKPQEAE